MTKQERALRDLMYDHDVRLVDLADHYDVAVPTISTKLMSLTPSSYQELEKVILEIANARTPTKVAS